MNIIALDILKTLMIEGYTTQKKLSELSGYSVGKVNQSLALLRDNGFLSSSNLLTSKAIRFEKKNRPRNAVILAAGIGLREYPSNRMVSKGLIEFNGEIIIERLIRQLHEVGVDDITIVVGFMKESYDYLIDEFGVKLTVNEDYEKRNNLHSLNLVSNIIGNTYILPCDLWFKENPFSPGKELFSWYMVSDEIDANSNLRVNRKHELVETCDDELGNSIVGVSYITDIDGISLVDKLHAMDKTRRFFGSFWDEALFDGNKMSVWARMISSDDVFELNSFNQINKFEHNDSLIGDEGLSFIAESFDVDVNDIVDIYVLKNGTTNRSFHFSIAGNEYVIRIPHRDFLIDRRCEYDTYSALKGCAYVDDVICFDRKSGMKISKYITHFRIVDIESKKNKKACLRLLKEVHASEFNTGHVLDIWSLLGKYEALRVGDSVYRDYKTTRANVFTLKDFISEYADDFVLCHGEPVADNFLIDEAGNIKLVDWENAGMQDPDMDLALMAVYSCYTDSEIESLIDVYHEEGCSKERRKKIYAYISMCGLMSSNWCEYISQQGIEFGSYSMKQYRYAKDYYRKAIEVC